MTIFNAHGVLTFRARHRIRESLKGGGGILYYLYLSSNLLFFTPRTNRLTCHDRILRIFSYLLMRLLFICAVQKQGLSSGKEFIDGRRLITFADIYFIAEIVPFARERIKSLVLGSIDWSQYPITKGKI